MILTMGFTGKKAEQFFALLRDNGVKRLIDIRLNNTSQLAAFTKKDDLAYFLKSINNIEYLHRLDLAPTPDILDDYKKNKDWAVYEQKFNALLKERKVEDIPKDPFDQACLLCSEPTPEKCHRRLVAEYLQSQWKDIEIKHI